MIFIYILLIISYIIIFWLIGYIKSLQKTINAQVQLDNTLKDYVIKNRDDVELIKNSIFR